MAGTDEHMHLGRWWMLDRPNLRVFGLLRASPDDDMTLSLAGHLATEVGDTLTIRGRTRDREPVTLLDCMCTSSPVRWNALHGTTQVQEFHIGTVLLGGRARDSRKTHFRFAAANFSSLPTFIGRRPFGYLKLVGDDDRRTIGVERSSDTRVRHRDTEIVFSVFTGEQWSPTAASLDTKGRFSFYSRTPRTLDEWNSEYLWPVATLVSLALGRACAIFEWTVLVSAPWWTYVKADKSPPEIRVFRSKPLTGPEGSTANSPLFTLADDGIDLAAMLPRWLEAYPEIRLPLELYFSTVFAPFMYLETRFLNLVQAAEGYHRVRFRSCAEDPLVHLERLVSIYGSIESREHLRWLSQRIGNHSNEPSLRRRLVDLAGLARRQGLKLNAKDAKGFALEVKNARDELSHGGLGERKAHRDDYIRMQRQLKLVLQACWLSELGLSDDVSARLLRRAL